MNCNFNFYIGCSLLLDSIFSSRSVSLDFVNSQLVSISFNKKKEVSATELSYWKRKPDFRILCSPIKLTTKKKQIHLTVLQLISTFYCPIRARKKCYLLVRKILSHKFNYKVGG